MILHSEPDSDAAKPTDSFTWTFPGAPVRINIRFGLISRLQTELNRHVEIGGVLLGHKGRAPATVEIRDCIRIGCENPSDGLYALNVSELERLRQTDSGLEEHTAHGSGLFCNWYAGLSVVGYFRTQSKDVLRLRDAEIELVRKRFPDPSSVVLLIETGRQQNEAGFFFPNTSVPFSFMNFPFDAALLQRRATPHLMEPPAPPSEEVEEAPPEPEIDVNRGYRENLGIRTRLAAEAIMRTLAARCTLLFRALGARSATSFLAVGGAARRWVPPITRSALVVIGAVGRWVAAIARSLLPAIGAMRRRVPSIGRSLLAAIGVMRRRLPSTRSLLGTAGAVLVLTALCALLLTEYRTSTLRRSVPSQAGLPFQLSVRAEGKGVDVRWDPQSTALAEAREGRLVIAAPKKRPKIVKLDSAQLASGHTFYRSSASGLNFRLDIIASSGKVESSTPVAVPPTAARQLRPAGFTFTPAYASQAGTAPKHMNLTEPPDPPESVPTASAKSPSVRLRASLSGVKANQPPTAPDSVEPVVTSAVSALPSVDEISLGTERQDITEKFGAPAFSTETIVRGHALETMVYGPDRAHTQTIISLKDGKVFSLSSR